MSRIDAVGWAKQTVAGTKQTTAEYFTPVESVDVTPQRDEITVDETTGHRYPSPLEYGIQYWKLKFDLRPRLGSFPRVLSTFFGAPTTTTPDGAGAPTAKKHTFGAGVAPVPHSIYVVRKDPAPAITDLFYDVYGDDVELSMDPSGVLKATANMIALNLDATQTAPTVTLDTSARVQFDQVVAMVSVNGGAEAPLSVRSFNCKYSNAIDTDAGKVLGSRLLAGTKEGNAEEELTLVVADNTQFSAWYRRNQNTDPDKVKVRLVATGALIASAQSFLWEHDVYAAEVTDAPANIDAGQRLNEVQVKFRCRYDDSVSKFVEHVVENTVASY